MFTQDFMLSRISVGGEVSNCKYHSSGHIYFSLKDGSGSLACVMFAGQRKGLAFAMKNGDRVIVTGSVDVYERDGKYQMYARKITLEGAGILYERFLALKEELEEMGMFAPEYKQPIPSFVQTVGVVTAPTGAVIQDIRNVTARRNPYVQIILYPAQVQGQGAAESIARALALANAIGEADVILCGRGGGSMEDLWAFNEEVTARAIYASEIPVISAVGHEPDVTIADFVADLRAPTPSGAAELAVPDRADWKATLEMLDARLRAAVGKQTEMRRRQLQSLSERLSVRTPVRYIAEKRLVLDTLTERLQGTVPARLAHERQQLRTAQNRLLAAGRGNLHRARLRFTQTVASLDAMSPLRVLSRGYAVATKGARGAVVTDAAALKEGDALHIRFAKGAADCRVIHTEEEQ